ncbi:MAG: ribulose-phosphate 3-epimerase [Bacilli bacterium]|nr:ribulose-phosphate 3-epimerase [Bacilli bacterium]
MVKISVSILSSKDSIIETVKKIDKTDAEYIHIDIMDGKFVSNKSFIFSEIKKISKYTSKKLDVHLMVENPSKYIKDYALLDTDYITVHYEIGNKLDDALKQIREVGLKCGISINPETNIESIYPYLDKVDLVLIMSVNPGKGGQEFIDNSLTKIEKLRDEINRRNLNVLIEVDGGINEEISLLCIEKGIDIIVSGSYITNTDNYQKQINKIRNN